MSARGQLAAAHGWLKWACSYNYRRHLLGCVTGICSSRNMRDFIVQSIMPAMWESLLVIGNSLPVTRNSYFLSLRSHRRWRGNPDKVTSYQSRSTSNKKQRHENVTLLFILAETKGFPRTTLARRLRGNRDDLPALHWSNLLVVEPAICDCDVFAPLRFTGNNKMPRGGHFIIPGGVLINDGLRYCVYRVFTGNFCHF